MKSLSISILFITLGLAISGQLSAQTYELWLNSSYTQELMRGEAKVLLSKQTSKMGKYGPTKMYPSRQRPLKTHPHFGTNNYAVYIKNVTSNQLPNNAKQNYAWVGMDSIYTAAQGKNPDIKVDNKKITLDPDFFAALVQDYADGNNPNGFVSGNIELLNPTKENPGLVDQDNLDSSLFE